MAKRTVSARSSVTGESSAALTKQQRDRQVEQRHKTSAKSSSKAGAAIMGGTTQKRPAARTPSVASIVLADRASTVAAALGSKAQLAALLEVSPSQPTRWIDGSESPNSENARLIVDLDHVIARAGLLWKPTVIGAWLNGSNAFLDGARPIDVLRTTGSVPVIDALDQELAGGYA